MSDNMNPEQILKQLETLKTLQDAGMESRELVAMLAPVLKPVIDDLISGEGRKQLRAQIEEAHAQLTTVEALIEEAAPQLVMAQMLASPDVIKQGIAEAKQKATQGQTSIADKIQGAQQDLETVRFTKQFIESMSEEEHIKFAQGLNKIMPPALKAFFNKASEKGSKSIPQVTREVRAIVLKKTEAELLSAKFNVISDETKELAVEGLAEMLATLDINNLHDAAKNLPLRITADDIENFVVAVLSVARDVIDDAENGKDFDPSNNANVKDLQKSLKKTFAAIEDTCIEAGLVLPNADAVAESIAASRRASIAKLKI